MKIKLLVLAVVTATVSNLSIADTGATGSVSFSGSITRPTCVITPQKGGD